MLQCKPSGSALDDFGGGTIFQVSAPPWNLAALFTEAKDMLRTPLGWFGSLFGKVRAVPLPVQVEARSMAVEVPAGQVWKNYILAGGQRVAVREYTSINLTGTVYFLLGDHLGSTSVVVNASTGEVESQIRYSAYGEERYTSGMTPTNYRYTGQLSKVATVGLYHYGARWFDPALAHFVQADTIVPGAGNPQSWDRYLYTLGNPIRYNDPSGHDVGCGGRDGSECTSVGKLNPIVLRRQLLEKHRQLVGRVRNGQINDLEGLAALAKYAASFTPINSSEFVDNLGSVLTGHDSGNTASNEVKIQIGSILKNKGISYDPGINYSSGYTEIAGNAELMQSGYAQVFQDPGAGQNQAHHYWFNVQVGYENGLTVGVVGSALHETILAKDSAGKSYEDYALGVQGVVLGKALRVGLIEPIDVGSYLNDSLSPGSYSSYYWEHPVPYIP